MNITRINEFHAMMNKEDDLRECLASIIPLIESSASYQSCQLLQCLDESGRLVSVETRESVEAYKASIKIIPPDNFAEIMKVLVDTPRGAYSRCYDGK